MSARRLAYVCIPSTFDVVTAPGVSLMTVRTSTFAVVDLGSGISVHAETADGARQVAAAASRAPGTPGWPARRVELLDHHPQFGGLWIVESTLCDCLI